jgi:uncharacterized membrane protein YeaQ/YmgE (transglycosylase-associated protein family)
MANITNTLLTKEVTMRNTIVLYSTLLTLLCTGCATKGKTTLLGMSLGVSTGAITGAVMKKDKKGVLLSTLAFGLIGTLTGLFGHGLLEKRDAITRKETVFNLEKFGVQGTNLRGPFDQDFKKQKSKDVYIFTDNPKFFE